MTTVCWMLCLIASYKFNFCLFPRSLGCPCFKLMFRSFGPWDDRRCALYLKRILDAKMGSVFCKKIKIIKKKKACTPRGPTATHTQCCLLRETLFQIFTFIILGKLFLFRKKQATSKPIRNETSEERKIHTSFSFLFPFLSGMNWCV